MTTDCKHAHIQTWRFEDSAEVAGLWSCTDCGRRFEPVAAAPVVDMKVYDDAYDMIDRFLRNSLDDSTYADYSAALDRLSA